jgi:hypothetical protein
MCTLVWSLAYFAISTLGTIEIIRVFGARITLKSCLSGQ